MASSAALNTTHDDGNDNASIDGQRAALDGGEGRSTNANAIDDDDDVKTMTTYSTAAQSPVHDAYHKKGQSNDQSTREIVSAVVNEIVDCVGGSQESSAVPPQPSIQQLHSDPMTTESSPIETGEDGRVVQDTDARFSGVSSNLSTSSQTSTDTNKIGVLLKDAPDAKMTTCSLSVDSPTHDNSMELEYRSVAESIEECNVMRRNAAIGNIDMQESFVPQRKENIGDPPPPAAKKSVRFASTNKMKEFDGDREVTSLLKLHESNVELLNNAGKMSRRRKRARVSRLKLASAHIDNAREHTATNMESHGFAIHDLLYSDNATSAQTENNVHSLIHKPSKKKKKAIQIAILHSHSHTQILHRQMHYIHQDRDILLESLLKWCGIFRGSNAGGALSSFLTVLPPNMGTRKLLETFHQKEYLDLLEFPPKEDSIPRKSLAEESGDSTNASHDESIQENHNSDGNSSGDTIGMVKKSNFHGGETFTESFFEEQLLSPPPEEAYLQLPSNEILEKYGLEDDCPFPTTHQAHALLWKYCLAISGASWHAASLLTANDNINQTDVAIHWGGGRHHAHANKAGGFCYVSDVILAIHRLIHGQDSQIDVDMLEYTRQDHHSIQRNLSFRRVLYIDIDIHHADAVQAAFYATDQVLTASFHRYSPGFFPASSGSTGEKGEAGTSGLGYNLNVPLPSGIGDVQFIQIYRKAIFGLVKAYEPHAVVLCVGADGLEGDELISGSLNGDIVTGDGWSLSPEGLAECVRIAAALCSGLNEDDICVAPMENQKEKNFTTAVPNTTDSADNAPCVSKVKTEEPTRGKRRKLLVLGGGGYTPAQTARTYLLCSAAACEGARPGMLWSELPRDIPAHDYFPRYGPLFELISEQKKDEIFASYSSSDRKDPSVEEGNEEVDMCLEVSDSDRLIVKEANRTIELATLYIERLREKKTPQKSSFCYDLAKEKEDESAWLDGSRPKKKSSSNAGGRRRKKKKTDTKASQQK